jgi:hypothetical protein
MIPGEPVFLCNQTGALQVVLPLRSTTEIPMTNQNPNQKPGQQNQDPGQKPGQQQGGGQKPGQQQQDPGRQGENPKPDQKAGH